MTLTEEQPRVERHASWLELFFDLTVVAAAIQVSHRLHDAESLGQVAACGAVFYAVWSVWTAFSVYVNVGASRTWLFGFAVPGLFASLVLGTVAEPLAGWASAVCALLILAWQLGYPRLSIPREGVRTSGDRKDA